MTEETKTSMKGQLFVSRTQDADIPFKLLVTGNVSQHLKVAPMDPDRPQAIVFVIDVSGSMCGEPMTNIQNALMDFVAIAAEQPNLVLHVVLFGSYAKDFRVLPSADEARAQIQWQFNSLGGTNYDLAVKRLVPVCENLLTENPTREITMVFCSDGQVCQTNAQSAHQRWADFVMNRYMTTFSLYPNVLVLGIGSCHSADILDGFVCADGFGQYKRAMQTIEIYSEFLSLVSSAMVRNARELKFNSSIPIQANVYRSDEGTEQSTILDGDDIHQVFWVKQADINATTDSMGDLTLTCNGEPIPVESIICNEDDGKTEEIEKMYYTQLLADILDEFRVTHEESALAEQMTNAKSRLDATTPKLRRYLTDTTSLRHVSTQSWDATSSERLFHLFCQTNSIINGAMQHMLRFYDARQTIVYASYLAKMRRDVASEVAQARAAQWFAEQMEARRVERQKLQARFDRELSESEAKQRAEAAEREAKAREEARRAEAERIAFEDEQQRKRDEEGAKWLAKLEAEQKDQADAEEAARLAALAERDAENKDNSDARVDLIAQRERAKQAALDRRARAEQFEQERIQHELDQRRKIAEEDRMRRVLQKQEEDATQKLQDEIQAEKERRARSVIRVNADEERQQLLDEIRDEEERERLARESAIQKERQEIGENVVSELTEAEMERLRLEEAERNKRESMLVQRGRTNSVVREDLFGEFSEVREAELEARSREEELLSESRRLELDERRRIAEEERVKREAEIREMQEALALEQESMDELNRTSASQIRLDELATKLKHKQDEAEEALRLESERIAREEAELFERTTQAARQRELELEKERAKLEAERMEMEERLRKEREEISEARLLKEKKLQEELEATRAAEEACRLEEEERAAQELFERTTQAAKQLALETEKEKARLETERMEMEAKLQREREEVNQMTVEKLDEMEREKAALEESRAQEERIELEKTQRDASEARLLEEETLRKQLEAARTAEERQQLEDEAARAQELFDRTVQAARERERQLDAERATREAERVEREAALLKHREMIGASVASELSEAERKKKEAQNIANKTREEETLTRTRRDSEARLEQFEVEANRKQSELEARSREEELLSESRRLELDERRRIAEEERVKREAEILERKKAQKVDKEQKKAHHRRRSSQVRLEDLSATLQRKETAAEEALRLESERIAREEAELFERTTQAAKQLALETEKEKARLEAERMEMEAKLQREREEANQMTIEKLDEMEREKAAAEAARIEEERVKTEKAQQEISEARLLKEKKLQEELEATRAAEEASRVEQEERAAQELFERTTQAAKQLALETEKEKARLETERIEMEARLAREREETNRATVEKLARLEREKQLAQENERKQEEEAIARHARTTSERRLSLMGEKEREELLKKGKETREEEERRHAERASWKAAQEAKRLQRETATHARNELIQEMRRCALEHNINLPEIVSMINAMRMRGDVRVHIGNVLELSFDGVLLNEVVNVVSPGCVDMRAVHRPETSLRGCIPVPTELVVENIRLVLGSCAALKITLTPSFEARQWLDPQIHGEFLRVLVSNLMASYSSETCPSVDENKVAESSQSMDDEGYVAWLNSLPDISVGNLCDDLSDAVILLEILEMIHPNIIQWRKIRKTPRNKFEKINNANLFFKYCRRPEFNLQVIGFSGQDLVGGNMKLIQSLLFQLVKLFPEMVEESSPEEDTVAFDEERLQTLVAMANEKISLLEVVHSAEFPISRGDEESLSNGLFYLDYLRAVMPGLVQSDCVFVSAPASLKLTGLSKLTSRKKRAVAVQSKTLAGCWGNVRYAMSLLRRIGCEVDGLPDALLRREPSAVISMLEAIGTLSV